MKDSRIYSWIGFCLLLLLGLIWFLLQPGREDEAAAGAEADGSEPTKLTALTTGLGSVMPQRTVEIKPAKRPEQEFDPYEAWDTEKILARFGVRPGKFDGATMQEVVAHLERMCEEDGGRGIEFRIEGGGGHLVSCEFGNVSAASLMELVAKLGGYDLTTGDGEVVFRRKPPVPAGEIQEMRLSEDFASRLNQRLYVLRESHTDEDAPSPQEALV